MLACLQHPAACPRMPQQPRSLLVPEHAAAMARWECHIKVCTASAAIAWQQRGNNDRRRRRSLDSTAEAFGGAG
jgi:hypothetical protein